MRLAKSMLVALLLSTGCSSPCPITTDPPGARAFIDGEYLGETPLTVELGSRFSDSSGWRIPGSYGWNVTDHRILVLVEGDQWHAIRLERHDTLGIPYWPASVRYEFEKPAEAPARIVPVPTETPVAPPIDP